MSIQLLKNRFRKFTISVASLIQSLPKNIINNAYLNQLIRCSSSSAVNYYAVCRGKSSADSINKLKIVEEKLDDQFFYGPTQSLQFTFEYTLKGLMKEGNELMAITVQSIKPHDFEERDFHSSIVIRNSSFRKEQ